jgi:hypothetical protein
VNLSISEVFRYVLAKEIIAWLPQDHMKRALHEKIGAARKKTFTVSYLSS